MSVHADGTGSVAMPREDQDLVRQCRAGDVHAYAELVRRHRRAVYGLARGILGDADEAEDVAQEAFIRAYRALGRLGGGRAFLGWLRRIAVNCAITRLRQRGRDSRGRSRLELLQGNPDRSPHPVEHLEADRIGGRVRAAVGELPTMQRLAFTLFHLQDMDIAETAQAMGCSRNAVKVHLHRARRKLAHRLAAELQEG